MLQHIHLADQGTNKNVFTKILSRLKEKSTSSEASKKSKEESDRANSFLQFEIHYLDTKDKTLMTFLCNKSRIVLVFDFLLATSRFILRKDENEYRGKQH